MSRVALLLLALGACAAGCSRGAAPLQLPDGCQPLLAGWDCFLPYPSAPAEAETPPHEELRRHQSALSQMEHFLDDGTVVHTYGVCSPD